MLCPGSPSKGRGTIGDSGANGDNGNNGANGDSVATMMIPWQSIGDQWRQWITIVAIVARGDNGVNGDNGANSDNESPMATMNQHHISP